MPPPPPPPTLTHLSSGLPLLEARRHMSNHPVAAHRSNDHCTLLAACPCEPGRTSTTRGRSWAIMALMAVLTCHCHTYQTRLHMFLIMYRENKNPSELKKAKVVPLPKSTDKTNPTNYRPISLMSVLSKLLRKHLHMLFK